MLPRPRFSLRAMLGVAFFWALLTGLYFASIRDEISSEQRAKSMVSQLGGTTHAENYKPLWLRTLLADQDLRSVTVVHLEDARIEDADLSALAELPELGGLHLRGATISDRALTHIQGLRGLRQLDLSRTGLHVIQFSNLPYLQDLNLTGCEIKHLQLVDLPALQSLNLGFSSADDDDLNQLTSIVSLTSLDLRNTNVTDKGLDSLRALKNLTTVYVYSTAVTRAGVDKLQRSLPKCRVIGAR